MHDEIIEDLFAIKAQLASQAQFNIRRTAEEVRQSEITSAKEGWKHINVMPSASNIEKTTEMIEP